MQSGCCLSYLCLLLFNLNVTQRIFFVFIFHQPPKMFISWFLFFPLEHYIMWLKMTGDSICCTSHHRCSCWHIESTYWKAEAHADGSLKKTNSKVVLDKVKHISSFRSLALIEWMCRIVYKPIHTSIHFLNCLSISGSKGRWSLSQQS